MVKLSSFFHRDPPDKEAYIKRERELYEKKRKKFLEEQTKDENAGQQSELDRADDALPDGKPKKGLRDKIHDFKVKRRLGKEEKELKQFRKMKEREKEENEGLREREEKVYGKQLSATERAEFKRYKQEKAVKREASKQKTIKALKTSYETAKKYNTKLAGIGSNVGFGVDVMGGKSILDISASPAISQKKADFEMNFGNLMAGKRPKKKKGAKNGIGFGGSSGAKPLSFNVFDG